MNSAPASAGEGVLAAIQDAALGLFRPYDSAQPRLPDSWPVRAVQARYPGHSSEPSAADAVCFVHSVGVEGCILG